MKRIGKTAHPENNEILLFDDEPLLPLKSNMVKATISDLIPVGRAAGNMKQRIMGSPPSKSNSYIIIILKNKDKSKQHGSLAKTKELKEYETRFALQCNIYRNQNIDYEFEIEVDAYFQSRRSDLDNVLKGLMDCLQQCHAIKNDNLCMRIVANKYIDPANPRIEFTIKPFKQ